MKNMISRFTLLEVVISLVILSLSLTGMLRLLSHSQSRVARAEEQWREMHMLTQGVEYLMLAGSEEDLHVPDEVFPYPDYLIDCTVEDAEGLPEELKNQENQLPLKKWTISLHRTSDRAERLHVIIDRLELQAKEDDDETE